MQQQQEKVNRQTLSYAIAREEEYLGRVSFSVETVGVTLSEEELGNGGMKKGFLLALLLLDNFLLLLKAIKMGQRLFRK